MTAQPFRLASGGRIDRSQQITFKFDGRTYTGYQGDTLASALMANGVRLVARSFKYHRPRGILTIGSEEPNALVHLGAGAWREPNTRATTAELYDGLVAASQHASPSLHFDRGRLNGLFAPMLPAGFYYKTFMGPTRSSWMFYEHFIRQAAGLGEASRNPDPDIYEKMYAHADVLVIGGGVAGLAAALAAGGTGARVVMADEAAWTGGWLLRERDEIDGLSGADWVERAVAQLNAMPDVRILSRTTAFGMFDGGTVGAVERVGDHISPAARAGQPRQRLWIIRAKRVVLATGAIEQPLLFAGNDRPGVLMAGAARGYVNQYAVAPGRRVVLATSNDSAYQAALDLLAAGVEVTTLIDSRESAACAQAEELRAARVDIHCGAHIAQVHYARRVYGLDMTMADGRTRFVDCDCVAMSGGWAPAIHLASHLSGRPVYDERLKAFVAQPDTNSGLLLAGAVTGAFDAEDCRAAGYDAGLAAVGVHSSSSGSTPLRSHLSPGEKTGETAPLAPPSSAFADFQNDVTVADVALAVREGYISVEHLKRYTTLGMGTDQGKTSNLNALTLLGEARGLPPAAVGITTFRPPFTPVALGVLAGRERGQHFTPIRRTPMQEWHEANGAVLAETGLWRRPKAYPRVGESLADAARREVGTVRASVGLIDVSTLGKIEVQGPDAATFLDRVCCTPVGILKPGMLRHALMLREDGLVLEDCTVCRLADDHYYLSTTTVHAGKVMDHLERYAQVIWPNLKVRLTSATDHFGAIALAGPKARDLLRQLGPNVELDTKSMPYASIRDCSLGGAAVRLLRISYSGELAYEIHVPAGDAPGLWLALLEVGKPFGIAPYGTNAMGVMRIEKGYPSGPELDGRVTPGDLGMMRLVATDKDFVGRCLLARPGLCAPSRPSFTGFIPVDRNTPLRAGAQITADAAPPPVAAIGHISSACFSPTLGYPIALGFLADAEARQGETVFARFPLRNETVAVKVVQPVFYDQPGERYRA